MFSKEAAKAQIKKLESDMLGLVYRLKCLRTQPGFSPTTADAFNARSAKPSLNHGFHRAGRVEDALKLQISAIRSELAALMPHTSHNCEFRMAG